MRAVLVALILLVLMPPNPAAAQPSPGAAQPGAAAAQPDPSAAAPNAPPDAQERRIALVIGETDYRSIEPLRTGAIDARSFSAALSRLDFEVETGVDLDGAALLRAVNQLAQRARGADIVIVAFFGHGQQVEGRNYLLPTDIGRGHAPDWATDALPLERLVAAAGAARRLGLVLVDASRPNGLTAAAGGAVGLAPPGPVPANVVVGYATQANTAADDAFRFNSAYAAALLAHVAQPDVPLGDLLRRVRQTVINDSSGRQEPSIFGNPDVISVVLHHAPPPPPTPEPPPPIPVADAEAALWQSIESSTDPADFAAYLARFPNGAHAAAARDRRTALARSTVAVTPPPPQPPDATHGRDGGSQVTTAPPTPEPPPTPQPPTPQPPPPETLPPPVAEPPPPSASEDPALTAEDRRAIQMSLRRLGLYNFPIDATFGTFTRAAIREFQQRLGAEPTGFLSPAQIDRLYRAAAAAPPEAG